MRPSAFRLDLNGFVQLILCLCACHAAGPPSSIGRSRASLHQSFAPTQFPPFVAHPSRPQYDDDFKDVVQQRRTSSTFSVTNKADAYMASLKGIKIDFPDSPGDPAKQNQVPSPRLLPPQRLPLPPKPPAGPSMTYAEKLKLAKEGKGPGAAAPPAAAAGPSQRAEAAVAPQAAAAVAAPAANLVSETPPPTLSYSERLKQAQEAKSGIVVAPAQPAPAPVARPPVQEVPSTPVRLLEQEVPESELLGEDAARAKVRTASRDVLYILCEKRNVAAF